MLSISVGNLGLTTEVMVVVKENGRVTEEVRIGDLINCWRAGPGARPLSDRESADLKAENSHLRLLLDREEKASERVSQDLWALRQTMGSLCDLIGVPGSDDTTDAEVGQQIAKRCRQFLAALGVPTHVLLLDRQDQVDAHRNVIDRQLSQIEAVVSNLPAVVSQLFKDPS